MYYNVHRQAAAGELYIYICVCVCVYEYYKYIHARSDRAYTSVPPIPVGATAADNIIVVETRYMVALYNIIHYICALQRSTTSRGEMTSGTREKRKMFFVALLSRRPYNIKIIIII